jgi:hypothetical protein
VRRRLARRRDQPLCVLDPDIFLPANELDFPSLLETSKKQGFDVTLTLDF